MREILPLFAVPVYKDFVVNQKQKEIINFLDNAKFLSSEDEGSQLTYITEDYQILNNDVFDSLLEEIKQKFSYYSEEIIGIDVSKDIEFYILASWGVKILPGGKGRIHKHAISFFSGVCYLDVDENSSMITFHNDDCPNLFYSQLPLPIKETHYNEYNAELWRMPVKQNQIIFFPSNLKHSIEINSSFKRRYSIAFDFFVKGSLKRGSHGFLELK